MPNVLHATAAKPSDRVGDASAVCIDNRAQFLRICSRACVAADMSSSTVRRLPAFDK